MIVCDSSDSVLERGSESELSDVLIITDINKEWEPMAFATRVIVTVVSVVAGFE
jgi:hypothetical protein